MSAGGIRSESERRDDRRTSLLRRGVSEKRFKRSLGDLGHISGAACPVHDSSCGICLHPSSLYHRVSGPRGPNTGREPVSRPVALSVS